MIAPDDRAVANAEDLRDGVSLGDRRGEDVEVVALVGMHLLAIQGALDRDHAIAQHCRALVVQCLRSLLHVLLRVARERLVSALEEEHAAVDGRAVLIARGLAHAGRGAALEVVEQARAATGKGAWRHGLAAAIDVRVDPQLAGAVRKELLQEVERLVHGLRVRERTEVARRAVAERARA